MQRFISFIFSIMFNNTEDVSIYEKLIVIVVGLLFLVVAGIFVVLMNW